MKADLATQTSLARESRELKKKLNAQSSELAALQLQLGQMAASLNEAQAQNKTLSAKLAANRTVATSVESANAPKVPGSAMKAGGGIRMIGSAEAAQAAQAAQLKEDLYSDLTGLIIRSVQRKADEDVFDCIQTARNRSKSILVELKY
jgi:Tfp pilus assembly protein FimV